MGSLRAFLACSIIYCLFAVISMGFGITYICFGNYELKRESENLDDNYVPAQEGIELEARLCADNAEADDRKVNDTPQ